MITHIELAELFYFISVNLAPLADYIGSFEATGEKKRAMERGGPHLELGNIYRPQTGMGSILWLPAWFHKRFGCRFNTDMKHGKQITAIEQLVETPSESPPTQARTRLLANFRKGQILPLYLKNKQ